MKQGSLVSLVKKFYILVFHDVIGTTTTDAGCEKYSSDESACNQRRLPIKQ